MQIHIVGGFLGSGKTTAIIAASRALMAAGKKVGIITNDQGKYLVDSSFIRQANLPGVEVTGGCFCCNYDNLDQRLDQLIVAEHPDIVFAESVGSCADLVATVIKPMLQLRQVSQTPTSFTVFTDCRLLRLYMSGEPMPFSDEVSYIFGKQIEESQLTVLNKSDLLPRDRQVMLLERFHEKYPDKTALLQCSLADLSISDWLEHISSGNARLPEASLDIDYQRYGAGEARLAWVDVEYFMTIPGGAGRQAAQDIVESVFSRLDAARVPVGHVKFYFDDGLTPCKISLTSLQQVNWQDAITALEGTKIRLLVNARAEMKAENLRNLLEEAIGSTGWQLQPGVSDAFHPRQPKPTHRIF